MLMLLLQVEGERYALESKHVLEVLPQIGLKKLHHAPEYIAGSLNYRDRVIPIVDLRRLMRGTPCQLHLSTRIVLVNFVRADHSPCILGLLAEQITQVLDQQNVKFVESEVIVNTAPYLGNLIADEQGLIQCIRVEHLLPEMQAASLVECL